MEKKTKVQMVYTTTEALMMKMMTYTLIEANMDLGKRRQ